LHHSAAAIELGDLRLQKETSLKSSFSLEGNFNKMSFGIDTYANKVFDFMVLEPINIESTLRGSFLVWEYKQVDAVLAGIDFYLNYSLSDRISANSNFSYLYGEDLSARKPLIAMPAPSLNTNIVYTAKALRNFKLTLKSKAVFEQKRYPNNDFVHTVQNPITHQLETKEVAISKPPKAYHLLGLDAETSFATNAWSKITVGVSATNLLDAVYSDYLNRQRYYANDNQRNISIQIKYNY
jgi:iron complex outermembrane receptor protein